MSGMQGRNFPGDEGGLKIPVKTEITDPIRIAIGDGFRGGLAFCRL